MGELPFELALRSDGTWRSRWVDEKLFIVVGGTAEGPTPVLLDSLRDVVTRWSDVKAAIGSYVAGLARGHHVPLDPASRGGFAAETCGFDQPLAFQSIVVEHVEAPERVEVTFYTGYPDGYATYSVLLEHGVPTSISAFAS